MTEFYLVCEWLYEHFVPIGGQFDQNLVTQSKKKSVKWHSRRNVSFIFAEKAHKVKKGVWLES